MFQVRISASEKPMQEADVAICQRVFDRVCAAKRITSDYDRDHLAIQIIHLYQDGTTDEDSLSHLVI